MSAGKHGNDTSSSKQNGRTQQEIRGGDLNITRIWLKKVSLFSVEPHISSGTTLFTTLCRNLRTWKKRGERKGRGQNVLNQQYYKSRPFTRALLKLSLTTS